MPEKIRLTIKQRLFCWLAWALWLIPMLVITSLILAHPLYRNVTPGYHAAVANWWALQPVYTGPAGFNYLPSFLLGFSLFAWLPLAACEILWRWIAFAGLAFGLWCFCGLTESTKDRYRSFVVATVLAMPICMSALRNGQSSAHLAACLILAAWSMHGRRFWWSALWLCLALVCKPLGIVAIGLAVMTFPRLRLPVLTGVFIVLVCPYFFAPTTYVNDLYVAFANNLVRCFDTGDRTFADMNGVLVVLGFKLIGMPSLIARVTGGIFIAAACWLAGKLGEDVRRSILWIAFTAAYIMLFTPMNEANSFVMLAPALGLWAWWLMGQGSRWVFRIIVAISVTIFLLPDLVGLLFGKDNANQFAKFWDPLMTLAFLGILLGQLKVPPSIGLLPRRIN